MTTVAAYAKDGAVYMASDTVCNVGSRHVGGVGKILKFPVGDGAEHTLIAYSGAAAGAGLLRSGLEKGIESPVDGSDLQGWADDLALTITGLYVDAGCLDDGKMDANLLIGFQGNVWTLNHATAVRHPDGIASIGSGADIALGALEALRSHTQFTPTRCVAIACGIAIDNDCYSGGDVSVQVVGDMTLPDGEGSA